MRRKKFARYLKIELLPSQDITDRPLAGVRFDHHVYSSSELARWRDKVEERNRLGLGLGSSRSSPEFESELANNKINL